MDSSSLRVCGLSSSWVLCAGHTIMYIQEEGADSLCVCVCVCVFLICVCVSAGVHVCLCMCVCACGIIIIIIR